MNFNVVVSDFARGHPAVLERIKGRRPEQLALTTVTMMEVAFGLQLNPRRARRIGDVLQDFMSSIAQIDCAGADALATATPRAQLRRTEKPIGAYDALIAGTALARGLTLAASNRAEFDRVGGLAVEDWRD